MALHTLGFLRSTRRGQWAGAELGCHSVEGRVENSDSCGSWSSLTQGNHTAKSPPRLLLVRIRVRVRVAIGCLDISSAHSVGRQSRAGLAGLLQEASLHDATITGELPSFTPVGTGLQPQSSPSQQQDRGRSIKKVLLLSLENMLEVAQIASLPMLEEGLSHTPSIVAEEAGNAVILCDHMPCSEREVDNAVGSPLDISAIPLSMFPPTIQPLPTRNAYLMIAHQANCIK